MWMRGFVVLIGVVCVYHAVPADIYIGEVMVESNVTLDSDIILTSWAPPLTLTVTDSSAKSHTVTLNSTDVVAECVIIGPDYSCNCSVGYVWSNEVCYTYGCCRDTTCNQNISLASSICLPAVNVLLNGSIQLSTSWTTTQDNNVKTAFDALNGLKSINSSVRAGTSTVGEFRLDASVRFNNSKLQEIATGLKSSLAATFMAIDTHGLVTINGPQGTVKYKASPVFNCTFDELTDKAGWNLSKEFGRFELNNGQQVSLVPGCTDDLSCIGVNLMSVTSIWAGVYECGFTKGYIRHTARTRMEVAFLPDTIIVVINPLVADCSAGPPTVEVNVTATIPNATANYTVEWSSSNIFQKRESTGKSQIAYFFRNKVSCTKTPNPQNVSINFINDLNQTKQAYVEIPVIYAGAPFCDEEVLNGDTWPKTPEGSTVINRTCPEGRVGFKSRTCETANVWQDVFYSCVNEELNKISNAADNFLNGLGASQDVASDIFEGMKNNSKTDSNSTSDMADINASVDILGTMADASKNFVLKENVLPNLVDAASNMLNSTWKAVNDTVRYDMSSKYLMSMESLVRNIQLNISEGLNSTNLELKFCTLPDCNLTAFDITVNLNMTVGTLKIMAAKNLMAKLKNGFRNTDRTELLLSANLLRNESNSSLGIKMGFPDPMQNLNQRYCVFWNTTMKDWSDTGCSVNSTENNQTNCGCNHLTSFAVLMAKTEITDETSSKILDIITIVGLTVSIISLLIFLTIESLVWSAVIKTNLSHFRHTAIVNIGMFRLLGDCSFLASFDPKILPESWCLALTVCKHLFYLAMFTWMLCLSVMLVHQLIFVFSPLRKRVFMFLSSILGYVFPMGLVAASYVYYKYKQQDYFNKKTCWLVYEKLLVGSIHAFILPVGTIVLANLFSMVVVIVTLMKASVPDSSKVDEKETAKSILKVVVFLTPVFGVTWAIGFFLQMLSPGNVMYDVALYSFTILNSFQGLFILLSGCLTEQKVREELMKIIKKKSGNTSDSTQKLTSATYTKDK